MPNESYDAAVTVGELIATLSKMDLSMKVMIADDGPPSFRQHPVGGRRFRREWFTSALRVGFLAEVAPLHDRHCHIFPADDRFKQDGLEVVVLYPRDAKIPE